MSGCVTRRRSAKRWVRRVRRKIPPAFLTPRPRRSHRSIAASRMPLMTPSMLWRWRRDGHQRRSSGSPWIRPG